MVATDTRTTADGNVIQTVSRTLMEELKYDRSAVTSLDWETYRSCVSRRFRSWSMT